MKGLTKTQELKNFSYFGITHVGNVRAENEDFYDYFETINGSAFIICDGMGGVKGGKIAAETAVLEIKLFLSEEWNEDPKSLMAEAVSRANNAIFERFSSETQKPGTTVVLALIRQNKIWYTHAGDSRLYYFTGKKLFQLTKDHSYVMDLVDKKIISEDEAATHPRRNEITKALGIQFLIDPSICNKSLEPADNDHLLLCSDGLVNELSNKEISEILINEKDTKAKAKKLLKKALDNGGIDNITIQLLTFYNTGKDENIDFLKERLTNKSKRKYKIITFFFSIIIILTTGFFLKEFIIKEKTVVQNSSYKSGLTVFKSDGTDTLVELFLLNDLETKQILEKFHADMGEIGHVTGKSDATELSKYYIPVKCIRSFRTGSVMYSIPDISKKNMIDIMIANNKEKMYFSPGEIYIIPKDKKKQW